MLSVPTEAQRKKANRLSQQVTCQIGNYYGDGHVGFELSVANRGHISFT